MNAPDLPPVEVSELAQSEGGPPALTTGGSSSGVYGIWCEADEKWYVGISMGLTRRANKHFSDLRRGKHHCRPLQSAWNKYKPNSFLYVILEPAPTNKLLELEADFISKLSAMVPTGFNLTSGGDANLHVSEATRRLLSSQRAGKPRPELRGRKMSPESNAKRSAALKGPKNHNFGKKFSAEHLAKLSAAHKGRRLSVEHKAKLSNRMSGAGNPNYGKKAPQEKLHKMRLAALGKIPSEKARANMSAAQYGRKHPEETKEKIRKWHLGRKLSELTIQKIKETKRRARELRQQSRTTKIDTKNKP